MPINNNEAGRQRSVPVGDPYGIKAEVARLKEKMKEAEQQDQNQSWAEWLKEEIFGGPGRLQQVSPYSPEQQAIMNRLADVSGQGQMRALEELQQEHYQPTLNRLVGPEYASLISTLGIPVLQHLLSEQQSPYPTYGGNMSGIGGGDLGGILGGLLAQAAVPYGVSKLQGYLGNPASAQKGSPQAMNPVAQPSFSSNPFSDIFSDAGQPVMNQSQEAPLVQPQQPTAKPISKALREQRIRKQQEMAARGERLGPNQYMSPFGPRTRNF